MRRVLWTLIPVSLMGCATAGSTWMSQPLNGEDDDGWGESLTSAGGAPSEPSPQPTGAKSQAKPGAKPRPPARVSAGTLEKPDRPKLEGKVLGTFRNTYYDFPAERDFKGNPVSLKNARCKTIKEVPRGFYETLCVQGSGTLTSGSTVSFAKRDCECAEVCPRTEQKICFDELDRQKFPWGRGATGQAITPLVTVAVDSNVIPLGTPIYIPEYDGVPRDEGEASAHDGCFIAQDRGLKIKDKHVDVFTGHESVTKLWNRLVPSNQGVTVVLDSPRCARAEAGMPTN